MFWIISKVLELMFCDDKDIHSSLLFYLNIYLFWRRKKINTISICDEPFNLVCDNPWSLAILKLLAYVPNACKIVSILFISVLYLYHIRYTLWNSFQLLLAYHIYWWYTYNQIGCRWVTVPLSCSSSFSNLHEQFFLHVIYIYSL